MTATPPRELGDGRVLRYRGDPAADWDAEPHDWDAEPVLRRPAFQGPVVALAIIDDEPTGGVFTLFLYADGWVADEWQPSLEDALAALDETDEFDGLPWVET